MLNNNKAILDAPIPPTVVPVTATPLTAVPITTSAPVVVTSAVTLPAPLLPANQAQENKQEIVENYLNSLPPPVTINNIINDRSAIYFSCLVKSILFGIAKYLTLQKRSKNFKTKDEQLINRR